MVVKTGVKNDGTLVAREVKAFWNGGAYGAMKPIPSVNLPGAVKAAGSYRFASSSGIGAGIIFRRSLFVIRANDPRHRDLLR